MYPNKNVTGENTESKQAMLKLNTFMLQRRCRPLCCNVLYYYIIEPKQRWNCKQGSYSALCPQIPRGKTLTRRFWEALSHLTEAQAYEKN